MGIPWWHYVVSMSLYFAFLMGLIAFSRKYVKASMWFWIMMLATFPIWIKMGYTVGWFRWFKVLSVLLPTALVVGPARVAYFKGDNVKGFLKFFKGKWVLWFFFAMLGLNILEATVKDFEAGYYANGIAGAILILTMPTPKKFWRFAGKKMDLLFFSTVGWNFLYTTWNLCFVYGEGVQFVASSFCILMAAEIYPIIKKRPELYIISRIYTLAWHMLMRTMAPFIFTNYMDASEFGNAKVLFIWGIINMAISFPYIAWYIWAVKTGKAEKKFIRTSEAVINS